MYKTGHIGVSLLISAPVGYALAAAGEPTLALLAGAVMVWLSMLPDVDHRLPLDHRGSTHTLLFAVVVGLAFAWIGAAAADVVAFATRFDPAALGFLIGFLTVLAHLLADLLTPMGVGLFWPASNRRYSLGLTPAKNPIWNYALFALGILVASATAVLVLRSV